MRLNTSTPTLFAISSLFSLGSSLPFFARKAVWLEPLVRRATYSVVPVDGGPATSVETVTEIPAPATKTIIETDRLPGTTDYIISTNTIEESGTVQTVVVTITPSPATVTTTGYSIIDVNSPPVTIVVPAPAPSSSSSSTVITTTTSSSVETSSTTSPSLSTTSSTTSSTSSIMSSTSTPTSLSASYSATIITSISVSMSTTSSSTTHSYDNGQWHTYYPAWSNATATSATSQSVQTTSAVAAMPTLEPSTPMKVPADSVPPSEPGEFGSLGARDGPVYPGSSPIPGHYGVLNEGAVRRRGPLLRRMRTQDTSL